jgi:hypothetical protein
MNKSRTKVSPDGFWKEAHRYFSKELGDLSAKKRSSASNIVDSLMSCAAMFSLKMPSLLEYDTQRYNEPIFANLKNLFHVQKPPSDTTIRERLDEIEPSQIRGVFKKMFAHLQRGKVLEQYEYWQGHYLMLIDATGHFHSDEVYCKNCCVKKHQDGSVSYYHQMLSAVLAHPHMKRVIPLAPEPITKQDGATKNDCEHNAAKRLLQDFRREHPHLKTVVSEDSLYSTGPHIHLLKELDIRFIIGAKPGNLGTLFDWMKSLEKEKYAHRDAKGTLHEYEFINQVPLNDTHSETMVNFLEYWETGKNGKKQHFSWITDIPITKKNVEWIMRGGRARWRIENETFNTLKNQGYNFEHNFGHGKKYLCSIMAMLMLLAFFVDQMSELCNIFFQKARLVAGKYSTLWERMRTLLQYFVFPDWDALFATLAKERSPTQNTS